MKESPKGSVDGVSPSTCVSPRLKELSSCSRSTSSATPPSAPGSDGFVAGVLVSLDVDMLCGYKNIIYRQPGYN